MLRRMGGFMTKVKTHFKDYFEGLSQVLFLKNAVLGFLFLSTCLLFKPEVFLCGLLASGVGYAYASMQRTPKILKQTGLLTINGFFFGIAMAALFQQTPQFYICLLVGAAAIPLVTKASFEVLQHWKLTPLIIPYILAIWVLFLCADGIGLRHDPSLWGGPYTLLPLDYPSTENWFQLFQSTFVSIGTIFFFQNMEFGMSLFLLISIFCPRRGIFFLMGTVLAVAVFYQLTEGQNMWHQGFFSYSAGLVGLGLASLPEKFSWRTILLFCVLSLFITLALNRLLTGFALPLLSLPYVLTFWFALLSRVPRLNVSWAPAESF